MGGQGIFLIANGDNNLDVIIDSITNKGRDKIVSQEFLANIKGGDKRIIIINGTLRSTFCVENLKDNPLLRIWLEVEQPGCQTEPRGTRNCKNSCRRLRKIFFLQDWIYDRKLRK